MTCRGRPGLPGLSEIFRLGAHGEEGGWGETIHSPVPRPCLVPALRVPGCCHLGAHLGEARVWLGSVPLLEVQTCVGTALGAGGGGLFSGQSSNPGTPSKLRG